MCSRSAKTASRAARAWTPTSGRGSNARARRAGAASGIHADRAAGGRGDHRRDRGSRRRAAYARASRRCPRGERAPRAAPAGGAPGGDPAGTGVRFRSRARVLPLPAPGAQRPPQGDRRRRAVASPAPGGGHRDRRVPGRGGGGDCAGRGGVPAERRAACISHRAQERRRALERCRRPRRDHTRAGRLMNCVRRAGGFTLVEILVALAVLAIALTATARSLGASIDTTTALRDRTLARWVAEDRLAQLELSREWPDLDVKEGDADMGGRAFHWRQETGVTPTARMRPLEVSVFLKGDDSTLVKMTGFVEQTATQAVLPIGPGSQTGSQPGPQMEPSR